jgi:hypothetical protein
MVHWGPTMTLTPALHVLAGCGGALVGGRATLVAGHSAYVPHGIHGRVLLDLGNLVDNSPVDPLLRNDLSLHWLVTLEAAGPRRIEGVPVKLEYAHRRVADDDEPHELLRLMARRCARVGSQVEKRSADGSCSSSDVDALGQSSSPRLSKTCRRRCSWSLMMPSTPRSRSSCIVASSLIVQTWSASPAR